MLFIFFLVNVFYLLKIKIFDGIFFLILINFGIIVLCSYKGLILVFFYILFDFFCIVVYICLFIVVFDIVFMNGLIVFSLL